MNLADKIQAAGADRVAMAMRDDEIHGRSRFPAIEQDGADAYTHGYPVSSCPYCNKQALDAAGRIVPVTDEEILKAAAWRRGYEHAAAAPA